MVSNMLKLLSRRFRRDPIGAIIIAMLLGIGLCLYFIPYPSPIDIHEFGNHSDNSYEVVDRDVVPNDSNIRVAVYREGYLGNYEPSRKLRSNFKRPGDHGYAVSLSGVGDTARASSLRAEYGMNMAVSERIPMDRIVPDIRHGECKYWHYPEKNLPTATVVIVFHNEGLTTLMRTVHSVLLRSPRRYLREVLLVDDYSDKAPLKEELEKYIDEHFGFLKSEFKPSLDSRETLQGERLDEKSGKVRLVRNSERSGLIRSRARGARLAFGEVVVFLDAHCEVNTNWLVPLLTTIAENNRTLAVPIVDGIDANTFEYRSVYEKNKHFMGIWEWGMLYKEIAVDLDEHLKKHRFSEPYESPTHAGGLFAINRQYFLELGGYDEGLLVWGGENFELSFKVWQCGGRQLWVPCSRVGHIYRDFMPYSFGSMASQRKGPLVLTNYKRVIEVWFDQEYKNYFYTREPMAIFYDSGDISQQLAMKERLQCKSFDWFVNTHGQAVFKDFPRLPPNVGWGELRSVSNERCLTSNGAHPPATINLATCYNSGGMQMFRLNAKGQLGLGERCIDGNTSGLKVIHCKLGTVNGPWRYRNDTKQMQFRGGYCLTAQSHSKLALAYCDDSLPTNQQWTWHELKA